jgi:GNAT superfamily N-acetyltransferase
MKITVRPAAIADAGSLARVRVETWRTSYRGLIPEAAIDGMDIEKETRRWVERLQAPLAESFLFVAEVAPGGRGSFPQEPAVAGFCGGGPDRDADPQYSGELYAMYILQAYQGKGVGRTLVQAGVDWLRQGGHGSMLIWVLHDNLPARRLRGPVEKRAASADRDRRREPPEVATVTTFALGR